MRSVLDHNMLNPVVCKPGSGCVHTHMCVCTSEFPAVCERCAQASAVEGPPILSSWTHVRCDFDVCGIHHVMYDRDVAAM